jgi:hypothetical protein
MVGSMSEKHRPGISGMSLYVPALRVPLESWCSWTGNPWPKVQAVVAPRARAGENVLAAVLHRHSVADPSYDGPGAWGIPPAPESTTTRLSGDLARHGRPRAEELGS